MPLLGWYYSPGAHSIVLTTLVSCWRLLASCWRLLVSCWQLLGLRWWLFIHFINIKSPPGLWPEGRVSAVPPSFTSEFSSNASCPVTWTSRENLCLYLIWYMTFWVLRLKSYLPWFRVLSTLQPVDALSLRISVMYSSFLRLYFYIFFFNLKLVWLFCQYGFWLNCILFCYTNSGILLYFHRWTAAAAHLSLRSSVCGFPSWAYSHIVSSPTSQLCFVWCCLFQLWHPHHMLPA